MVRAVDDILSPSDQTYRDATGEDRRLPGNATDPDLAAHSLVSQNHLIQPRVAQDLLLFDAKHGIHARSNVVRHMDKQSRSHI